MNIIDIFKGIEKLVVELLLLLISIPKTIVKIIISPSWVPDYINEEYKKPDGYKNYLSPVMLYLIITVLLTITVGKVMPNGKAIIESELIGKDWVEGFLISLNSIYGVYIALAFLAAPLYFALIMELFSSAKFSIDNIKRVLYIHCYYFSPLLLAYFGWFISFMLFIESPLYLSLGEPLKYTSPLIFFYLILGIWWFSVEVRFISDELDTGIWKTIFIVVLLFGTGFLSIFLYYNITNIKINNHSKGEPESVIFKLSESGEYKIEIDCANKEWGEFDVMLETYDGSLNLPNYPSKGSIEYDQKKIGRLAPIDKNDFPDSITFNSRSVWEIEGRKGENLVIHVSPLKTQGDLLFHVTDSSGNIIIKKGKQYNSVLFEPKVNGFFKIIVTGNSSSDSIIKGLIEYELAVVRQSSMIYFINNYRPLEQRTRFHLYTAENEFINDSINYPSYGSLVAGQKIRVFMKSSNYCMFTGEADDLYFVIVNPITLNNNFDPKIDILNESGDSIFYLNFLPYLIVVILTLLFGFAFIKGIYPIIIKELAYIKYHYKEVAPIRRKLRAQDKVAKQKTKKWVKEFKAKLKKEKQKPTKEA